MSEKTSAECYASIVEADAGPDVEAWIREQLAATIDSTPFVPSIRTDPQELRDLEEYHERVKSAICRLFG